MRKSRPSVYETITAQIIEAIEQGAGDWQMPWRQYDRPLHRPANIDTSNRYRGINVLSLWVAAWTKNYSSGVWGTYRQWLKADCQVRRGEKSTSVVFYKQIESDEKPEQTDQDATQVRLIARASSVFNAEQVDGYTPPTPPDTTNQVEPVQAAQDFVTATADCRSASALETVLGFTVNCWLSWRTLGRSCPGRRVRSAIAYLIWRTICR